MTTPYEAAVICLNNIVNNARPYENTSVSYPEAMHRAAKFQYEATIATAQALLAIADAIRDTQHTCGHAQPDIPESPCALTTGHRGPHTDREGDTW